MVQDFRIPLEFQSICDCLVIITINSEDPLIDIRNAVRYTICS